LKRAAELELHTREGLAKTREDAKKFHARFPVKYMHGMRNVNVTGDYISNSKNAEFSFDSEEIEDCKFINHGHGIKDSYDSYVLVDKSERVCEVVSGITLSNVAYSYCVWHNYDVFYSDTCENSHHLFGSVSLRKKEYSILNKQYSKEEYETLLPKLVEHMKTKPFKDEKGIAWTYGDFFPRSFCPFGYNESVAPEYFPLTEQEALNRGFSWQKEERKQYEPTMRAENIPDQIGNVADDIIKEILGCVHNGTCNDQCTTAFKITPDELALYRHLNIPLPTLCFTCRHGERTARRNPRKLWQRSCMCKEKTHQHSVECANIFETSYAPGRPEKVYCESCYQQEVM